MYFRDAGGPGDLQPECHICLGGRGFEFFLRLYPIYFGLAIITNLQKWQCVPFLLGDLHRINILHTIYPEAPKRLVENSPNAN